MPGKAGKTQPPEREDSHRALLDKLGVKLEQRVAMLRIADESFSRELAARVSDPSHGRVGKGSDLIFLAADSKESLRSLRSLRLSLKRAGAIWVVYPKGQKPIREVEVIAVGKSSGLVDNRVVRFSETHTALRRVIPLSRR